MQKFSMQVGYSPFGRDIWSYIKIVLKLMISKYLREKIVFPTKMKVYFPFYLPSLLWTGSLVPYSESDQTALTSLATHHNPHVSEWANKHISYLKMAIKYETS